MTLEEKKIQELITKLSAIARKNGDRFRFRIELAANTYSFVCKEHTDGHEFIRCTAGDLFACVHAALAEIPNACKTWDYTQ